MKKILFLAITTAFISQASAQSTPAQQAEAFYRQGQAAEKAGDPTAAKNAYAAALKAYPNHANARYALGQVKINSNVIAAKGRAAKFGAVVVPEIRFDEATLLESLEALRMIVEKESKDEVTPNFVIQDPKGQLAEAKISLVLKNLPASGVLQYLLDQSNAKARYDAHAIVIEPR